ncbi:hypothetical protein MMC07_000827 [Pseudocyphellaria aurata]|nr:hypothetical protein [Pseudocyphellaria aurata]
MFYSSILFTKEKFRMLLPIFITSQHQLNLDHNHHHRFEQQMEPTTSKISEELSLAIDTPMARQEASADRGASSDAAMARLTTVPTVIVTPPPNPGPPITLPCAPNQALLMVPPPQWTRRQRIAWESTQAPAIVAKTPTLQETRRQRMAAIVAKTPRKQSLHSPGESSTQPSKLKQKRNGSISSKQPQSGSTSTPRRSSVHSTKGDIDQLILQLQRLEGNYHPLPRRSLSNHNANDQLPQSKLSTEKRKDPPPQSTLCKPNANDPQLAQRTSSQRCT